MRFSIKPTILYNIISLKMYKSCGLTLSVGGGVELATKPEKNLKEWNFEKPNPSNELDFHSDALLARIYQ